MPQEIETKPETASLAEILGPPPLLTGESAEHYKTLLNRVADSFGAADDDIILTILSKRFADSFWEEARYRRQRAVSIDRAVRRSLAFQAERKKKQKERRAAAIGKIAEKLGQPRNEFVAMIEREVIIESTIEDIDEILDRTPSELEHNRALEATILLQGQFDVLINSAERRQDGALELVDRYQALKQRRKPAKEIEGQFEEIRTVPEITAAALLTPPNENANDVGTKNSGEPPQ
jgi:hypothetical protein